MSQSPDSRSSSSDGETRSVGPSKQTAPAVTANPLDESRGRAGRPPASPAASRDSSDEATSTQDDGQEYPPDDARAMSPRRGREETEVLSETARFAVREQARQLQLSLLEIAESIELVKADHDKLEKQNLALQDYIGGLTRSMSKGQGLKGTRGSGR